MENTNKYKKGILAEKMVKKLLNDKGYVTYEAFQEKKNSKWEYFDILAIQRDNRVDQPKRFIADVKAKARMDIYHATGCDLNHFKRYIKMSELMGMPFKLFFVDEFFNRISYIDISKDMLLPENRIVDSKDGRTYPLITDFNGKYTKVILFSVEQLTIAKLLNKKEVESLRKYNTRIGYEVKDFDNNFKKEQEDINFKKMDGTEIK